jgi:hypothetical protein
VLLLLLIAGGGYNYWRNLQLEAAEDRPYRGYSDGDLEALRGAYDQEREVANRRFTARKGSAGVREGGFIDEQIDEFDRVHRLGREKRRLAGEVAANDSVLDELDRELGIRARDTGPWAAHLRRLTSF